ncbi:hypothetical protein RJ640_030701 [Escallonia rubra]|uniref:Uncharacterized protein n=1 Tax=Escallonia rubra TaxID=112253 RepID=A0AA88R9U9_9ASTE|nr:hypothetical protein RJ640_030701 [Escallonia rubra]
MSTITRPYPNPRRSKSFLNPTLRTTSSDSSSMLPTGTPPSLPASDPQPTAMSPTARSSSTALAETKPEKPYPPPSNHSAKSRTAIVTDHATGKAMGFSFVMFA